MQRLRTFSAGLAAAGLSLSLSSAEAAWTRHDTTSVTSSEKGVSVTRGPKPVFNASLEDSLAGGTEKFILIEKKVVVVNCFKPRRLTTHGFLGVRRYNDSFGDFGSPSFGFDDYDRNDLVNC
ncbi:MAG: hypothetical protein GC152_00590 [Alphaproteobacteria bacterium]|nr:hypothetical protein [Alphaproteobacteria bacterium]